MNLDLVKTAFSALRLDPPPKLVLLDAAGLAAAHVPAHPPDCAALLTNLASLELAAHLRDVLLAVYPPDHIVFLVSPDRSSAVVSLSLAEFVANPTAEFSYSAATCLYVPALPDGSSFEALTEIVAHLRAPNGCPWDREQTHESLRKHLLEETYETLAAIDSGDFESMQEEFGDLLLQVSLQTQIASEGGRFNITPVIRHIHDKLVRRHPHVFGDVQVSGVDAVLENWEKLKEKERGDSKERKGLLDGIPFALPALSQAQEYQDRAARVGFDWPAIDGVLDKIAEEIQEVRAVGDEAQLAEEMGDLFFALVNLARWKKVDAEAVLRETNAKFKRRLRYVEDGARVRDRSLSDMSLEEMDVLWEESKAQERGK